MSLVGAPDYQKISRQMAGALVQPPTVQHVNPFSAVTVVVPAAQLYEVVQLQATLPQGMFVDLAPLDSEGVAIGGLSVEAWNSPDEIDLAVHSVGGDLRVIFSNPSAAGHDVTWALRGYLGVAPGDLRPPWRTEEFVYTAIPPGGFSPVFSVPSVVMFDQVAFTVVTNQPATVTKQLSVYQSVGVSISATVTVATLAAAGVAEGVLDVTGRGFGLQVQNNSGGSAMAVGAALRARRFA